MDTAFAGLWGLTRADIILSIQASLGLVSGLYFLFKAYYFKRNNELKLVLTLLAVIFIVGPFYKVFTGGFYSKGKITVLVLSKNSFGISSLHSIDPWAFLVTLPCAIAVIYLISMISKGLK